MPDLIKILPPHVANQIAAGEAVQRPSSVVKELMENSVDAGSTSVTVAVGDGGLSLIQVADNGAGMSPADAENAFIRHSTSKISDAGDLFNLHTFGFRGEALASIAAVAEVVMRTKRAGDQLGTEIVIRGGSPPGINNVNSTDGTTLTVRNLFYNIPARRKFLKSASYETKLVIAEFQRVALVNPDIAFTLIINGEKPMFSLAPGNLRQRIATLTSKGTDDKLLPVDAETPVVRLTGYIGTPKTARKSCTEMFFFVNGRYINSPYLRKAVLGGYNKLIAQDTAPSYFIYIEVDPARLDVNIHPTKTEVKFEDDQVIWQIVNSAVRETLGKHNVVPALDFENDVQLDIPVYRKPAAGKSVRQPSAGGSDDYNPFKSYDRKEWEKPSGKALRPWGDDPEKAPFTELLPDDLVSSLNQVVDEANRTGISAPTAKPPAREPQGPPDEVLESLFEEPAGSPVLVLDGKYIITTTADGLVAIHYHRALQRIIYERTLRDIGRGKTVAQRQLHPQTINLSRADHRLIMDYADELASIGFEISDMGGGDIAVHGMPAELSGHTDPAEAIDSLLARIKEFGALPEDGRAEALARIAARTGISGHRKTFSREQAARVVAQLLATQEPNYTPDSLPVIEIIGKAELDKRFKK